MRAGGSLRSRLQGRKVGGDFAHNQDLRNGVGCIGETSTLDSVREDALKDGFFEGTSVNFSEPAKSFVLWLKGWRRGADSNR